MKKDNENFFIFMTIVFAIITGIIGWAVFDNYEIGVFGFLSALYSSGLISIMRIYME